MRCFVHVLLDGTGSRPVFAAHFPEWSRIEFALSRLTRMGCCADASVRTLALARKGVRTVPYQVRTNHST